MGFARETAGEVPEPLQELERPLRTQRHDILFTSTSSERYSEEIEETLYGDSEDHAECQRVEDRFDITNMVGLDGNDGDAGVE